MGSVQLSSDVRCTRRQLRFASLHFFLINWNSTRSNAHKNCSQQHGARWRKLNKIIYCVPSYWHLWWQNGSAVFNLHHALARLPPRPLWVCAVYFPGHKNCDCMAQHSALMRPSAWKNRRPMCNANIFSPNQSPILISHPAERLHNAAAVYWKMRESMMPSLPYTRGHFL